MYLLTIPEKKKNTRKRGDFRSFLSYRERIRLVNVGGGEVLPRDPLGPGWVTRRKRIVGSGDERNTPQS